METKGRCGAGFRPMEPESRNSETQEWVLRTVYVRRGVDGEQVIKFLTVRNLKRWGQSGRSGIGDSWNSPLRLKRQSRARLALYVRESCVMHEMGKRRDRRFGASVNQTKATATQAKGKSRQIKANQGN